MVDPVQKTSSKAIRLLKLDRALPPISAKSPPLSKVEGAPGVAPGASSPVGYVDDDGLIVALYGVAGDATSSDSVHNEGGALIVTAPIELVFWGDQWRT